jgi:hypothetical protein
MNKTKQQPVKHNVNISEKSINYLKNRPIKPVTLLTAAAPYSQGATDKF